MPVLLKILLPTIAAVTLCLSCSRQQESAHREIYQELKSADKMVLATMSITKTATIDKSRELFGKRIAVYSYDTYMRACIDLSRLTEDDISFDEGSRTVRITLPPVETELSGREMELRKEYDNIGLLRDSIDARERAELKELANASLKEEISNNPEFVTQLTEEAKRKARSYFTTLLSKEGYTAEIDFRQF